MRRERRVRRRRRRRQHGVPAAAFQNGVRGVVGDYRGTPDIALSAAVDGGVTVYTFYDADDTAGASSAVRASRAAVRRPGGPRDATGRHRLGVINPALYRLASRSDNGIVDVTLGDNSYGDVTAIRPTRVRPGEWARHDQCCSLRPGTGEGGSPHEVALP